MLLRISIPDVGCLRIHLSVSATTVGSCAYAVKLSNFILVFIHSLLSLAHSTHANTVCGLSKPKVITDCINVVLSGVAGVASIAGS